MIFGLKKRRPTIEPKQRPAEPSAQAKAYQNYYQWKYGAPSRRQVVMQTGRFDRKAGYGEGHPVVENLRRRGWTRRLELGRRERKNDWKYPNKWFGVESSAMIEITYMPLKGKVFLDIGCGYSPDARIAKKKGARAYRLDLYSTPEWEGDPKFILADYCERIPLEQGSVDVVLAQATLNLNSTEDRRLAYKQVKRVLKKGGYFVFYTSSLLNEHDWDLSQEISALHRLGFAKDKQFPGGAVMKLVRKRVKSET